MNEQDTVLVFERGQINAEQYATLMRPLNGTRVAKRSQGGKQLSYLEAWDVKAHLTRVFGFGNWDLQMLDYNFVAARDYQSAQSKDMVEVIYSARMQLTIRDEGGREVCRYSEAAVGSASGPANMLGEHHDNALKTAASDATKRCAINLGTQFGLSLYDNGSTRDVIRGTVVKPEGVVEQAPSKEQAAALAASVGAGPQVQPSGESSNEGHAEPSTEPDVHSVKKDPVTDTAEQLDRIKKAKAEAQAAVSGEPQSDDLVTRRREMFALMNEAKFSNGDEGRVERLGYCESVINREVASSNELTRDEVVKVIESLRVLLANEKATA